MYPAATMKLQLALGSRSRSPAAFRFTLRWGTAVQLTGLHRIEPFARLPHVQQWDLIRVSASDADTRDMHGADLRGSIAAARLQRSGA